MRIRITGSSILMDKLQKEHPDATTRIVADVAKSPYDFEFLNFVLETYKVHVEVNGTSYALGREPWCELPFPYYDTDEDDYD